MNKKTKFYRKTNETEIQGQLNLAGKGVSKVLTGIGFLDHMLDLWAFHSGFDLILNCQGDLQVCAHHSIEDIAIVLGNSFFEILGDRKGIARYATVFLPMDETLTRTVVDISGRPCHIFHGIFGTHEIGSFPVEMTQHFFQSFATSARLTLHQEVMYGDNDHHKVESLFKGFGKALAQAITVTTKKIPSSKGVL